MKFILGLVIGMIAGSSFVSLAIGPEVEKMKAEDDPTHGTNYVWENLVEIPEDRSGADTWFQQEYDALEWSWQRMVRKYDHMQLPEDMAADVLTFNYLPWVQELRDATAEKDLPYKDLKLEILDLRIQSLTSLEKYYRAYKKEDYDDYIMYDSSFREIIKNNPQVFD